MAKRVLAVEQTRLVHGQEATEQADAASRAMVRGQASDDMPTWSATSDLLDEGTYGLIAALADSGLCKSRGEARRAIQNGGIRVDNEKVSDIEMRLSNDQLQGDGTVLRFGKKRAVRIVLAD